MTEHFPEDDIVSVEDQKPVAMMLSNRTYDLLKPFTQIILPGLITLWLALSGIWDWSYVEEVAGTMGAINVFFGLLLGLSGRTYNNSDAKFDGAVQFRDNPLQQRVDVGFALDAPDPKALLNKTEVVLKVIPPK